MNDHQNSTPTQAEAQQDRAGWFRAMRTPDALELIAAAPLAYVLAAVIAHRARYNPGFNRHNLALGEALIGDYRNYGMTRAQYRTARAKLRNWQFATFRTTNKGSVAKLSDARLFSVFRLQDNQPLRQQATSKQPASNHQTTTNEEREERKNNERAKKIFEEYRCSIGNSEGERPDWNGLTVREKTLSILGHSEITKRPDWITRLERYPNRIENIMDAMHSDIATGRIIKNRGAYAESLWKIAK